MPRKSPCHYIAPSAISITPNANDSANDLAVYIARNTKIRVHSRTIKSLGMVDSTYQEWTLAGRNRRLAMPKGDHGEDLNVPYTIYARLRKIPLDASADTEAEAREDGYLIFVPKTLLGHRTVVTSSGVVTEEVWVDKYSCVTDDGLSVLYTIGGQEVRYEYQDHWCIRLGEVSKISGGKRTVTLDTGILGTDQFNVEWELNPDALPLRVELDCKIDGKDVGQTPYVAWEKVAKLSAKLVEGWGGDAKERVSYWTIARSTGNDESDSRWNYPYGDSSDSDSSSSEEPVPRTMDGGRINLSHSRITTDDFSAAFAAMFTVTAWGKKQTLDVPEYYDMDEHGGASSDSDSSSSEEADIVPLASAAVTMLAETVERYELALSTSIVSYSPQTNGYIPREGVAVHVRATSQSSETSEISLELLKRVGLSAEYAVVGSAAWKILTFRGSPAAAVIPVNAFEAQQSVNVRLVRVIDDGSSSSDSDSSDSDSSSSEERQVVELDRKTVAFVRDGEDSKEREWIYLRSKTAITFGGAGSAHPKPSVITTGEVSPAGAAGSVTPYDNTLDKWVPKDWYDHVQGITEEYLYEYGSYRDFIHEYGEDSSDSDSSDSDSDSSSSDEPRKGHWGPFTDPVIWSHYGQSGTDGDGTEYVFIRTKKNVSPVLSSATAKDSGGRSVTDPEYLPVISNATACDAETNGKAGECTDDPKGTTAEWPYEWVAKRTMTDPSTAAATYGKRVWKSYHECMNDHKMSKWSTYTTLRLDIDNEMDMVQTDSTGKVTKTRTVSTKVHLFDGGTLMSIGLPTVTVKDSSGNTVSLAPTFSPASGNATERTLSWTFDAGTVMAEAYEVTISYTYNNLTYTAVFTIAASMGQPVYQLRPTLNAITFSRVENTNLLTPDNHSLGMDILKIDGDSTAVVSLPTGFSLRYSTSEMPTTKNGGTAWDTSDGTAGVTWSSGKMVVANGVAFSDVLVALFNGNTLLDRETVPVIKDGANGDGIESITRTYAISTVDTASESTGPADETLWEDSQHHKWFSQSPAVTEDYPNLWCCEVVDYKYKADTTKYYFMGKMGNNGIDAKDVEWVFVRTKAKVAPAPRIVDDYHYEDSYGKAYLLDDHLPKVKVGIGDDISGNTNFDRDGYKTETIDGIQCHVAECTDDPQGVDDTWMYEWEIKRTKGPYNMTTKQRVWNPYSGVMTLHNNYAVSALVIDIDNDSDQFGTDSENQVINEQKRSTNVSLYYGTAAQVLNADNATTPGVQAVLRYSDDDSPVSSGVAVITKCQRDAHDSTKGIVEVTIWTGTYPSSKSGMYVLITATCDIGSKSIRFTLEKVKSGSPGVSPVIYQLAPTMKTFPFYRDASNNLLPSSHTVSIYVTRSQGNIPTTKHTSPQGLTDPPTVSWGFEDEETASGSHSNLDIGATIMVENSDAAEHEYVWVELSTGDRETLTIVRDGANGADGKNSIRLDLDNQHEDFLYSDGGLVAPTGGAASAVHLYDGPDDKSGDVTGWMISANNRTDWGTSVGNNANDTATATIDTVNHVLTVSGLKAATAKVTVRAMYNGKPYYADFTANRQKFEKYDLKVTPSAIPYNSSEPWTDKTLSISASRHDLSGSRANIGFADPAIDPNAISSISGRGILRLFVQYRKQVYNNVYVIVTEQWTSSTFTVNETACGADNIYFELRKYATMTATQDESVVDYETIPINKAKDGSDGANGRDGRDGANAVRIDLTNEADMISCDASNKVKFQRTIRTVARIYDGATPVTSGVSIPSGYTKANYALANVEPSSIDINNGQLVLEWTFATGTPISNSGNTLNINLVYDGNTYTAAFSLTRTESAAIYQLYPSVSEISFAVDSNNSYTPSSASFTCTFTKKEGGKAAEIGTWSGLFGDNYYIWYRYLNAAGQAVNRNGTVIADGNQNWYEAWSGATHPRPSVPILIDANVDIECVLLIMTNTTDWRAISDANIFDRETIPVVRSGKKGADGRDGANAVRIDLDNEADMIACDSDNKVRFARDIVTKVKLYNGSDPVKSGLSINASDVRMGNVQNGNLSYLLPTVSDISSSTGEITITWSFTTSMAVTAASCDVDVSLTYNGTTYSKRFTLTRTNSTAIYNVLPSKSEIAFGVDATTNEYTPENHSIYCGYTKDTGSGMTTVVSKVGIFDSIYMIWYRYIRSDGNPYIGTDVNLEGWKILGRDAANPLQISRNTSLIAIEFAIMQYTSSPTESSPSDSDVVDRETVPIIKSGKKGAKGTDGDRGPSAATLRMSFSQFEYRANHSGTAIGTQQKVLELWMNIDGTETKLNQNQVTFPSTLPAGLTKEYISTYLQWVLTVANGTSPTGTIQLRASMTANGHDYTAYGNIELVAIKRAASIRGPRIWDVDANYQGGGNNDAFLDIVIYNGSYYQCVNTHRSTSSDTPPNSSNWEAATEFAFVATDLLLAQRARIENLCAGSVEMRKDNKYVYIDEGDFEIGTYTENGNDGFEDSASYRVSLVDGRAVLEFWEDNELVGRIDSSLFSERDYLADSWGLGNYIYCGSRDPLDEDYDTYSQQTGTTYYKYNEGYRKIGELVIYNDSGEGHHSPRNGKWYTRMNVDNGYAMPSGWYVLATVKSTKVVNESGSIYKQYYMEVYYATQTTMQTTSGEKTCTELNFRRNLMGPRIPTGIDPAPEPMPLIP